MAKRSKRYHPHNQPRHGNRKARRILGRPKVQLSLQERMQLSLEAYRERAKARGESH